MPQQLSEHDREIVQQFEEGRMLRDISMLPGWATLLKLMERRVQEAEHNLINYNGIDKEVVQQLHRRARAFREFFEAVQQEVRSKIEAAREIPSVLAGQQPQELWEI